MLRGSLKILVFFPAFRGWIGLQHRVLGLSFSTPSNNSEKKLIKKKKSTFSVALITISFPCWQILKKFPKFRFATALPCRTLHTRMQSCKKQRSKIATFFGFNVESHHTLYIPTKQNVETECIPMSMFCYRSGNVLKGQHMFVHLFVSSLWVCYSNGS